MITKDTQGKQVPVMDVFTMVANMRKAGMSQPFIAEAVGTGQMTISRIEHRSTDPRLSIVRRIEAYYSEHRDEIEAKLGQAEGSKNSAA